MSELSENTKKYLLELARDSIEAKLSGKEVDFADIPDEAKTIAGTFVTLEKERDLRGCIGNLEARDEIYKSVVRNAVSAAFGDPRFPAVQVDEFKSVTIEISILTPPVPLEFSDGSDLLMKIAAQKPGLVIESEGYRATYLPQVWEELTSAEEFIANLCMKAGLPGDFWRTDTGNLKVSTYGVIKFLESDFKK